MMSKTREQKIMMIEAYGLYLLAGMSYILIGSSLPQLIERYQITVPMGAYLSSCFALGRFSTVLIVGYLAERLGTKKILFSGLCLFILFFLGIIISTNYFIALGAAFLGGVGVGTQDSCCPIILKDIFPKAHPSAMSAGQVFFGGGFFVFPMALGFVLSIQKPFYYANFFILVIPVLMMLLLPFSAKGVRVLETKEAPDVSSATLRNSKIIFLILAIMVFTYCASGGSINLYMVEYARTLGFDSNMAVTILTSYSIGMMIGAAVFTFVLKKVSATKIMIINLSVAIVLVFFASLVNTWLILCALFFGAGAVLGVLFSLLILFAVQLAPDKPGRAAAFVAIVGSSADTISPILSGHFISRTSILNITYYILMMLLIALVSAIIFRRRMQSRVS